MNIKSRGNKMNLLQAEFKSMKDHEPELLMYYIVTDFNSFMIAYHEGGFWRVNDLKLVENSDFYYLDFEPTHFAEIKTG
jgi:uncharacterized protein (DUF2249 family)